MFAQYLTTTKIPTLDYAVDGSALAYRWADVVPGFTMPVRVSLSATDTVTLRPTTSWQRTTSAVRDVSEVRVDPNFYVVARPLAEMPARE